MNDKEFMKWFVELANQEYKGNVREVGKAIENPTRLMRGM